MKPHYPRPSILDSIKLDRHAVIEASAGTGKTFTIEHLVIEILLHEPVKIDEVLVLTFTERAAGELRQRIRSKIDDALFNPCTALHCGHDIPGGNWLIDDEARRRLARALYSFDAAAIGTIHSFFGRVLCEHAFSNGRPFEGELADGRTLFGGAFKTALRRSLAIKSSASSRLLAVWLEQNGDQAIEYLESRLYQCHGTRRQIEPPFSLEAIEREIKTNFVFNTDLRALAERVNSTLKTAKVHGLKVKAVVNRIGALADLLDASGRTIIAILDGSFQKTVRELGARLRESAGAAREVADIAAVITRLETALVTAEAALVQTALPVARKFLEAEKAATGQFEFDDLIQGVVKTLKGPRASALCDTLRRRYRFALIDEFQDTDSDQWEFFNRVFVESNAGHRVYLIGDPKQAIYGFRGGDVAAYLGARQHIEQQASPRVPLLYNFRSTAALIEACNLIFRQSAASPFFRGEIKYDKDVETAPKRDYAAYVATGPEGPPTRPVYLLKFKTKRETFSMAELRRGLGWQIAREIRKLLTDPGFYVPEKEDKDGKVERRRVLHKDIYILTATNSDATQVSQFLRRSGIPFSFYKQDGLFETPEARELRDLLAAIDRPDDTGLRGRAWITPFFDVPLGALPQLFELDESHPLVQRLTAWNDLAERRQFETLFSRILDESGVSRRELFLKSGERTLTNYLHLCEILLEEARKTGCGLADLVTTLTAYIQKTRKPPGEDRDVQRLESDRDAVQIMTIHKSKGLEAAVVFVYGGFCLKSTGDWHEYHGASGERVLYLGDNPDAEQAAASEAEEERERVFYVALTRAKARLYLTVIPHALWPNGWKGGYKRVNDRLNALEAELPGSDFDRLFRVIEFQDTPMGLGPGDESRPAVDLATWSPTPGLFDERDGSAAFEGLKRRHAGYEVTSYSRMKRQWETELVVSRVERDREAAVVRPPSGALPGGTDAGTFLHEILELVPLESLALAANSQAWSEIPAVAKVIDDALVQNAIDRVHRQAAAGMAYLALTQAIDVGSGRSIRGLGRCARSLREMEFLFPLPEGSHPRLGAPPDGRQKLVVERGFIKGFVDLIVEHEGLVYFADWKSDVLESYDPGPIEQHVKAHYDIQAKLYSLALVKALGVHSEREYDSRFGGLVYVFLRGLEEATPRRPAVYFDRPAWGDILRYELQIIGHGAAGRGTRS
jgi:exodeoxyribonuclease V beta subunit